MCRRTNQPSERAYIERHNRRLFKRMQCPYGSGFASLEDTRYPQCSGTKHWIFILSYSDSPSLSPPHFFLQPILLSLPFFSSPSPRPNAAHNSRSQFSISADFSIRLRGAAVCTDSKKSRYIFFTASCCCPSSLTPGCRTDDIANWKALGISLYSLRHLEFLSRPANQTASMRSPT